MSNNLVMNINNEAKTTSLLIAEAFGKKHKSVIRAIESLEIPDDIRGHNFAPSSQTVEMPNGGFREYPLYEVTRDGFTLLAMGFTGKKAMEFKLKYIDAFNKMEKAIKGNPIIDAKTIGGIVKRCCGVAIREELGKISTDDILAAVVQEKAAEIARVMIRVKLEAARKQLELYNE